MLCDKFIVPAHFSGGGAIYSNVFFILSILADWYIHSKGVWVVSLESLSIAEHIIKKNSLNLVFPRSYRSFKFCELFDSISLFLFKFSVFLRKLLPKTMSKLLATVVFNYKTTRVLLNRLVQFSGWDATSSNFSDFKIKIADISSLTPKRASFTCAPFE